MLPQDTFLMADLKFPDFCARSFLVGRVTPQVLLFVLNSIFYLFSPSITPGLRKHFMVICWLWWDVVTIPGIFLGTALWTFSPDRDCVQIVKANLHMSIGSSCINCSQIQFFPLATRNLQREPRIGKSWLLIGDNGLGIHVPLPEWKMLIHKFKQLCKQHPSLL